MSTPVTGSFLAFLTLVLLAGCQPPITGPVTVPHTPEAQACARQCDERHHECLGICREDAAIAADPAARPVCDGNCDQYRARCYLACPGATEGKAP